MTASMDSGDGDFGDTNDIIRYPTFRLITTAHTARVGMPCLHYDLAVKMKHQSFSLWAHLNKAMALHKMEGTATAAISNQDGYPYGTFDTVSVGSDGTLRALYTNGITQDITTLKIALFNNLNGLAKAGDNLFIQTTASGDATYTTGGSGRAGTVASGFLEGSNVDMATELTALITAQRGFQLSTKVITTADEILAEAVNIKR